MSDARVCTVIMFKVLDNLYVENYIHVFYKCIRKEIFGFRVVPRYDSKNVTINDVNESV